MKMKISKSFRPCRIDDDDELYANGIFVFNITKLVAFLRENSDDFPIVNVQVKTLGLPSSHLDEPTVLKADITNPIVLAEISPDGFNVVDGNHRVERARRDGISVLPSYKVSANHHHRFLTTTEEYTSYIKYWNEKVSTRTKRVKAGN